MSWLRGDPPGWVDWATVWVGNLRIASTLVIVVANLYVARVLYLFVRRRADALPPPRVVVLFAVLVALGGMTHLVLLDDGRSPGWFAPVALKVVAAGMWVAVAVELPMVVAHLLRPLPRPVPRPNPLVKKKKQPAMAVPAPLPPSPTWDDLERMAADLFRAGQRLRDNARALEDMIRNESWRLDKDDALNELHEIIDDLGAEPCKI
jgi:hypothetical protein